jgi:curved DNA-binding protein CbpA
MDHFSMLGEARRPWLDPEALKARFLALSGKEHPDRLGEAGEAERVAATERFAALNAAFTCLREPRDRLAHLLELETGVRPRDVQRMPPGTMELFAEVGQTCQGVDAFLSGRDRVASPILRVSWMREAFVWTERVQDLRQRVLGRRQQLLDELQGMNRAWSAAPREGDPRRAAALPLERLEQVYRVIGYTNRWLQQLEERSTQLAV